MNRRPLGYGPNELPSAPSRIVVHFYYDRNFLNDKYFFTKKRPLMVFLRQTGLAWFISILDKLFNLAIKYFLILFTYLFCTLAGRIMDLHRICI